MNDAHHIRFLDSVRTNRPASIAKTKRRVKLFIQTQARRRFVERVLGRGTVAMARLAGAPMLRFFTRPLASRRVGASFARRAAGTVRHRALNTRRGWDCHVSGLEGNAPIRPGHYRRWIGRSRPSSGLPPLMTSVPWCCCSPASTTPITARCCARCTPVPGATAVCRSSTRRDRRGARPPRRGPVRAACASTSCHREGMPAIQRPRHLRAPRLRERGWHEQGTCVRSNSHR
jgi:hypothetical protein